MTGRNNTNKENVLLMERNGGYATGQHRAGKRRGVRYGIAVLALLTLTLSPLCAVETVDIIDTPTAATLPRGFFGVDFSVYDGGGINVRTLIGMTDGLTLGIMESVDRAIGTGEPRFHIPGALVKLRIFGFEPGDVHVSLGFGPEGYSPLAYRDDKQVFGVYTVVRKGFAFFTPDIYQFFNVGVRLPLLPDVYRETWPVNMFFSFSSYIGAYFETKLEVANILFNGEGTPVFNAGLSYHANEIFAFELSCSITTVNEEFVFNRMILLSFVNVFY